jgi:hypothetical protein
MSKVKTTVKWEILEVLDRFIDGATANAIGKAIVDETRAMIDSGLSPVRGYGRFERYKDRKKYPGKQKDARPVNLYLSGEMLDKGYGFRRKGNESIEIGMVKGSEKRKKIAGYHNEGTDDMAMRRFIPQEGEEYAVRVMRVIRDQFSQRLQKLISRSNKK